MLFTFFRKNGGSKIRDKNICKLYYCLQQVWVGQDLVWFCSEWGLKKTGHKADRKKVQKLFFKENLLKKLSQHWEKNNLSLNFFEFSYFFSFSNFRPPLRGRFPTIFYLGLAIWLHLIMIGPQKCCFRPKNGLIGPLGPSVRT